MIILTGGAGFIGSVVLKHLNLIGRTDVVVADSLGTGLKYRNLSGKQFCHYLDKDKLLEWLDKNESGVELIIHLGAMTDTKEKDVDKTLEENYYYSQALYIWAAKHKKRFIYASSSATYGNGAEGFKDDMARLETLKPLNPYAFSKHLFDLWAWKQKDRPVQLAGLKFFNVYGPNEYHKGEMVSVIYRMFNEYKSKGCVEVFGKGGQARDFIYVMDAAKIVLFFVKNPDKNGLFNAGTGSAVNFNDLAEYVCAAAGGAVKISYVSIPGEYAAGYQMFTAADTANLKKIGYKETPVSVKEGIRAYACEFLDKGLYF